MRTFAASLVIVVAFGLQASGCDRRPDEGQTPATSLDEEGSASRGAWDCATDYIKKNFDPAITSLELSSRAVMSCETHILKFEKIRGLKGSNLSPDLKDLLAERSASDPGAEARRRAHRLRLEAWRLAEKVADDYHAAHEAAASASTAAAAPVAPSASIAR